MAVNNEIAGERVFGNVDEALADRIVSRAKENSREPERAAGRGRGFDAGADRIDKRRSVSIFKIAVPVVLILIGLWVYIKSKSLK